MILLFVAVFIGYNQYWPGEFMLFVVYVNPHPKAQTAVVLVMKGLRRRAKALSLIRQTGRSRESNLQPRPWFVRHRLKSVFFLLSLSSK